MSLYHLVFGVNELSPVIVSTLRLAPDDFGRFRDAFVCAGEIAVYTRCGGGNRPDYARVFERMHAHPLFLRDEDDAFDNTYCTFFFSLPKEFEKGLLRHDRGPWDPSSRWRAALDKLKKDGPTPEMVKATAPIFEALAKAGEP